MAYVRGILQQLNVMRLGKKTPPLPMEIADHIVGYGKIKATRDMELKTGKRLTPHAGTGLMSWAKARLAASETRRKATRILADFFFA